MRRLMLLTAFAIGLTTSALAEDNLTAAQAIIRSQEQAFSKDDAEAAYGFAAPGIKHFYRTADAFMLMVRNGYAPVYRHRSFEFGRTASADGKILQEVAIVDADGVAWDALYTLEVQDDGSLKISGCVLKKATVS